MKKALLVIAASAGLMAGLFAQDGPVSVGSDTVAKPRKAANPDSATPAAATPSAATPPSTTPSPSGDLPKIPSRLAPRPTSESDKPAAIFTADANLVTVDVSILDNKNNFVPNIDRKYFRILEDNVPQTVKQFSVGQAPMTVALIVEFSRLFQWYGGRDWYGTLQTANAFLSTMKPQDYVAIIRYDLRSHIVCDFTNDRSKLFEAMRTFVTPEFSEANLFDVLTDTADRMSKIQGRKAIMILTSGVDTMSRLTYDQTRRKLQDSGVPIYSIGIRQMMNPGASDNITLLQADNEMKTFTKETGGQAFFPRWFAELPDAFNALQSTMRNQYTLGYSPSNLEKDGKFRKITVQLIDPATNQPLAIMDDSKKPKPVKYSILATPGYKAPNAVE